MSIPVQNLYYLLVYAWDAAEQLKQIDVGADSVDTPVDLFGRVLKGGIEHVIRRGLDRGYTPHREDVAGVRGKIHISESLNGLTFLNGRLVCEFDEFTHDVLHNRILKATLIRLSKAAELDKELRLDLKGLANYFQDVSDLRLEKSVFSRVQLHSNNLFYRLLIKVCEMIYLGLLPDQEHGGFRFLEFSDDQLSRIFESFVRNFYKRRQSAFSVSRERFPWVAESHDLDSLSWLPKMETDVSLVRSGYKLIVETKCYKNPFVTHRFSTSTETVRSGHIYQVFSYIQNLSRSFDGDVEGLLLYAQTGDEVTFEYQLLGKRLVVATLDLNRSPREIDERLLSLIGQTRSLEETALA